jgi:hypothetical protein
MKKRAKDELEEMFESLGELDEVRALTRSELASDGIGMKNEKVARPIRGIPSGRSIRCRAASVDGMPATPSIGLVVLYATARGSYP